MDIRDRLNPQLKKEIHDLMLECQVLENLLKERQMRVKAKGAEILERAGLSPVLYGLYLNPAKDIWEASLNEKVISLPGHGSFPNN